LRCLGFLNRPICTRFCNTASSAWGSGAEEVGDGIRSANSGRGRLIRYDLRRERGHQCQGQATPHAKDGNVCGRHGRTLVRIRILGDELPARLTVDLDCLRCCAGYRIG